MGLGSRKPIAMSISPQDRILHVLSTCPARVVCVVLTGSTDLRRFGAGQWRACMLIRCVGLLNPAKDAHERIEEVSGGEM